MKKVLKVVKTILWDVPVVTVVAPIGFTYGFLVGLTTGEIETHKIVPKESEK